MNYLKTFAVMFLTIWIDGCSGWTNEPVWRPLLAGALIAGCLSAIAFGKARHDH